MRSRALIGKSMPVLVTGPGTRPGAGQTLGRTAGNRAVVMSGEPAEAGSFILGSISSSDGWTHFASMVGSVDESRLFEASESWPAPDR
jgi:tRNA A37 methylthiotransferase MiaB